MAVWDKDRLSTDDLLGKASVELGFLGSLDSGEPVMRQVALSTQGSICLQFQHVRDTSSGSSQWHDGLPMDADRPSIDDGAEDMANPPIEFDALDRLRATYGEQIVYRPNYDTSHVGNPKSVPAPTLAPAPMQSQSIGAATGQLNERNQSKTSSLARSKWLQVLADVAGVCRALLGPVVRMVQHGATGENRMILLLVWDTFAFFSVSFLFVTMTAFALENERVLVAKQPTETGSLHELEAWGILLAVLQVIKGSAFGTWQAKLTFQVCKVIFSFSAFPFFIFNTPLGKLFAHADPTAYTRTGRLTKLDTNGLSAYLTWLKEDILAPNARFADEIKRILEVKDRIRLRVAIKDAERTLENAWKQPRSVQRVTAKKKEQLKAILLSTITRESFAGAVPKLLPEPCTHRGVSEQARTRGRGSQGTSRTQRKALIAWCIQL